MKMTQVDKAAQQKIVEQERAIQVLQQLCKKKDREIATLKQRVATRRFESIFGATP